MSSKDNCDILLQEIDWLERVINHVIGCYLQHEGVEGGWQDLPKPNLKDKETTYAKSITTWQLNLHERLAVALAMAPHIRPEALDIFFGQNKMYDRSFTEFGGVTDKDHSGFLPTGQTLLFLLTTLQPELRANLMQLFNNEHILIKEQVITLGAVPSHIPTLNGVLSLDQRWLHYFVTGKKPSLEQSINFPAKKITTHLNWEDVVLSDVVMDQVLEIQSWLTHGNTIMNDWKLFKKIKSGYRALFYGPPGTGKTLTATLLGKATERDVYRVDLSMIVSKYIGETEKNLSKIFDAAQYKNWILFFDEADALFGKRTAANSSNDRHANQQTSYLLQRIEDFPGTIILASNLKANMDAAFTRRFQAMIHFTMPTPKERYILWQNAFSDTCTLHPEIDIYSVAEQFELAGGAISNVLRYCALAAIKRNNTVVTKQELLSGIRKEFKKENKTIPNTI